MTRTLPSDSNGPPGGAKVMLAILPWMLLATLAVTAIVAVIPAAEARFVESGVALPDVTVKVIELDRFLLGRARGAALTGPAVSAGLAVLALGVAPLLVLGARRSGAWASAVSMTGWLVLLGLVGLLVLTLAFPLFTHVEGVQASAG